MAWRRSSLAPKVTGAEIPERHPWSDHAPIAITLP
jgi:hypothetical protein